MIQRSTAIINGSPTEVMLPDEGWLEDLYREFSARFFLRWKVPDGIAIKCVSGGGGTWYGRTTGFAEECGGLFSCTMDEAPTPRPRHSENGDALGAVWFRNRSTGEMEILIRIHTETPLPESAWRHIVVHEMIHAACYWNGLWTGDGHDGWFRDLADDIRDASGGEYDIGKFAPDSIRQDRDDVMAASQVPGRDFGFAVVARLGFRGTPFASRKRAGPDDYILRLCGWTGVTQLAWRCATKDEAMRAARQLMAVRGSPMVLDFNSPAEVMRGRTRGIRTPTVVGVDVYECSRWNIENRDLRKELPEKFAGLAELPDHFPAPTQTKEEVHEGQTFAGRDAAIRAGAMVKVWSSENFQVNESIIGRAVRRGMDLLHSVFSSLWGKMRIRNFGDGHAIVEIS